MSSMASIIGTCITTNANALRVSRFDRSIVVQARTAGTVATLPGAGQDLGTAAAFPTPSVSRGVAEQLIEPVGQCIQTNDQEIERGFRIRSTETNA